MDVAEPIKLDASESTDNVGVVTYTFKQNVSGTDGDDNYVDIPNCVDITEATCVMTPTNSSAFGSANWSRTYFKVEAKDAGGNVNLSGNRFVEVKKANADTQKPTAILEKPVFSDGSTIPGANNRIEGTDIGRSIKLDASNSTDNIGVVTYTFKKNISGTPGDANYVVITGCENISVSICEFTPSTESAFNSTAFKKSNWSRTYFKVEAKDAAGNVSDLSDNKFVEVKR